MSIIKIIKIIKINKVIDINKKSIKFFINGLKLPKNLKIIFSEGSKTDNLINTTKDRHAKIFKNVADLLNAGYIDASNNDLNAITDNKKVGLVYH